MSLGYPLGIALGGILILVGRAVGRGWIKLHELRDARELRQLQKQTERARARAMDRDRNAWKRAI